jgi:hypothetical protein
MTRAKKNDEQTSSQTEPDQPMVSTEAATGHSRRRFLKAAAGAGTWTAAASVGGLGSVLVGPSEASASNSRSKASRSRAAAAFRIRKEAAYIHFREKSPTQVSNGDEERYHDKRASFFKCLPQNELAEVDLDAYAKLLTALKRGRSSLFDDIPLSASSARKLANPQAAYAFDMTGVDSHATALPPAPTFASAEVAAEMGEVFWQSLARDVPYIDFESDPLIADAVDDLNQFSWTVGPTEGGEITPNTLFRQGSPGDLSGPYISQFLLRDVPYGPSTIVQRYDVPATGVDFMTSYDDWLAIQRGAAPVSSLEFDPTPRYIYSDRALGQYVHLDALFQAYFNAALIVSTFGPDALDRNNPYLDSVNQGGFTTFGGPHVFDLVTKAARVGLEGAWFHKWLIHRRLRPEAFAGRIENQLVGAKDYGVHPDVLDSEAVARVQDMHGTALLPQAYPEGSPTHPAYAAGHSVVAGGCATVLKAFFDENFVIPDPVQASANGLDLETYGGADLTLGGEINKLASNISVGRCIAGVHYRSDGNGLRVGEQQAIGILQDYSLTYREDFDGFVLTTLDNERIRIADGRVSKV